MRTGMLTVAVLAVCAGASAQTPEQYRDKQQELLRQFFQCVGRQAAKIDDRTSDATTIARGAVALCAVEANAAAVWAAGSQTALVPQLRADLDTAGINTGTGLVLNSRAAGRAAPVPAAKPKPKPKGEQI